MPVVDNLDRHQKVLLLLVGLCLPNDNVTNTLIKRVIAAAVGKIHKLRRERLRELEAPWLTKKYNSFLSLCSSMFISLVSFIGFNFFVKTCNMLNKL